MPNMKSNIIEDETGICKVTHYVHANPVHHGFVAKLSDWKYSSYNTYLSNTSTKISRQIIVDIFGGKEYFTKYHQQPVALKYKWDE